MSLLDLLKKQEAYRGGDLALSFVKEILGQGGEDNRARIQGIQDELKDAKKVDPFFQSPDGQRFGAVEDYAPPMREPGSAFRDIQADSGMPATVSTPDRLAALAGLMGPTPEINIPKPKATVPQQGPTGGPTTTPTAASQAPANVQDLLGLASK